MNAIVRDRATVDLMRRVVDLEAENDQLRQTLALYTKDGFRGKLAPFHDLIVRRRAERKSYQQIADEIMSEHGITVTVEGIRNACKRLGCTGFLAKVGAPSLLTDTAVERLRRLRAEHPEMPYNEIGKRFGVSGKTAWTYVNMRRVEERT